MLSYTFPIIRTLDDIRPVLETEGFKLYDKTDEGYYVVNYEKGVFDFPTPLHREARGLIFDREGKLIGRRFHKFFNMGEYPETSFEQLAKKNRFMQPNIMTKEDGSMVSPCLIDGKIYWMSKMGVTDTSVMVANFVIDKPWFEEMARDFIDTDVTPIFEYVGPHNRVVLNYKEDLILLAVRDNELGIYYPMEGYVINGIRQKYESKIRMPKSFLFDMNALLSYKDEQDTEGVVLRYPDGHMVKVKTDWYVKLHRAKDTLQHEYKTLLALHEGLMDDLMPLLSEEDRERIRAFYEKFKEDKYTTKLHLLDVYKWTLPASFFVDDPREQKKLFALAIIDSTRLVGIQRKILFRVYDECNKNPHKSSYDVLQEVVDEFVDKLIKQASSASYEKLKELLEIKE